MPGRTLVAFFLGFGAAVYGSESPRSPLSIIDDDSRTLLEGWLPWSHTSLSKLRASSSGVGSGRHHYISFALQDRELSAHLIPIMPL